ncbi:hypothetical protein AAE02nite_19090 [Adhaeribacter aerolatus]|uniref:DUF922 domain-containing protein n=1 Tax=Adhaeribacter aerolatus TaxID=670289 RepID=A0A512AWY6_9BACT|nr:hypothetical protein [Adhaeribacter aerolatus]GEO04245.1 hypothetical protein AAE02nite_19090 [Adhaeribacter aerolatus]
MNYRYKERGPATYHKAQQVLTYLKPYRLWLGGALLLIIFGAAQTQPVMPTAIVLKPITTPITPKEFFVAGVVDERRDRKAVAYLVPPTSTPAKPSPTQPIDLEGGGLPAIRQFILQGMRRNMKLRPVVVRVKEFKLTETANASGWVDGQVSVVLAFDIQNEGKTMRSVDYKGGARYRRHPNQFTVIEPTLRQSLTDALNYLNGWMEKNAHHTEELAQGLKVTFKDFNQNTDPDTLFYNPKNPLTWSDFRAEPRGGRFAAAVFPSFAYEGESKTINGVVHLHITVKVFVVRDASWVRAGRDDYGLNHEQRHFDIVKLIAERFKQKIKPSALTVEDYNSIIQNEFLESWREMTRLQEQYDSETGHGTNHPSQEAWNLRIDEELRKFGVRK